MKQASQKKINTIGFLSYELSKIVKSKETESRKVATMGKGEKTLVFKGYRVSVLKDKETLEI